MNSVRLYRRLLGIESPWRVREVEVVHDAAGAPQNAYTFFSGELLLVIAVLLFALYALADSASHSFLGAVFPVTTGAVMLVFGALLARQLTARGSQSRVLSRAVMAGAGVDAEWRDAWLNALWLVALVVGVWLLGFINALTVLFIALIRAKTGASWVKTGVITACGIGFLLFISNIMVLHLPGGILLDFFNR